MATPETPSCMQVNCGGMLCMAGGLQGCEGLHTEDWDMLRLEDAACSPLYGRLHRQSEALGKKRLDSALELKAGQSMAWHPGLA